MKIRSPESGEECYNSSPITTGRDAVGTRIHANSSEKNEMGQVKTKCADWPPSTSSRR